MTAAAPRWRLRWRWPRLALVGRELIAIANRRRTYLQRTLLACACLGWFATLTPPALRDVRSSIAGAGTQLGVLLVEVAVGVIAVVLPAMATVAIGTERTQGTLPLLLLTPISPFRLLVQKWLALVIAVLALLLVALPLAAIAYSSGGITAGQCGDWSVAVLVLLGQLAALCLLVASWSRSVLGGFLLCYLLLGVVEILLPGLMTVVMRTLELPDTSWLVLGWNPLVVASAIDSQGDGQASYLLTAATILGALWLASVGIRRRSAPGGISWVVRLLRALDRAYDGLERRWLRRGTTRSLPLRAPVRWRECHRQPLANLRYLVRLLVVPATVVACLAYIDVVDAYLWALAGVLVLSLLAGTRLLAAERADQSLEVLLSTPMTAPAIIRQAGAAAGTVARAGTILLLVLLAIGALGALDPRWRRGDFPDDPWWFADAAWYALVLPPALGWLAGLLAVRLRQGAAVLILALGLAGAWLLLPLLLVTRSPPWITDASSGAWLVDPLVRLLGANQALVDVPPALWPVQLGSLLLPVVVWLTCRTLCLRTQLLRRARPTAAS